jgi:putative phosphoesterase
MLIAVMSDTHDHLKNLEKAIALIRGRKAELIIHCGDFVAPFTLRLLDSSGIPVHGVFGNNDGDRFAMARLAFTELSRVTLHGLFGNLNAGGWNIAFTHHEETALGLLHGGGFSMVCFGHSHRNKVKEISGTLLLNPGELMGLNENPGFFFVDTATRAAARVEI